MNPKIVDEFGRSSGAIFETLEREKSGRKTGYFDCVKNSFNFFLAC